MPTSEELIAENAALRAQLARQAPAPTPRQLAVVRQLQTGGQPRAVDPARIQDQIDSITTVIASGVNSAGYGDKRTDFRSLSELRQILNGLEEALADALGRGGRIRQIRMTTSADKAL